jgi:hypothetical protein
MASRYKENNTANESVSKYKLLSGYGGPGSLVHTQYGSIIVSCIEEWGFLKKVLELNQKAVNQGKNDKDRIKYVIEEAREGENGNIGISNDHRLLEALQVEKKVTNLEYLVLIPDIEVVTHNNKIGNNGVEIAIPSTYMPKVFADRSNNYKTYSTWYKEWCERRGSDNNLIDKYGKNFHPPKSVFNKEKGWISDLKQDNIILLCEHGHISDFPWSKFLRWRNDNPLAILQKDLVVDLFNNEGCCNAPHIKLTSNSGNASGYDGKWLKCSNCNQGVSLKGLMNVKIKCAGHKPWEVKTSLKIKEFDFPYSGNESARNQNPPSEVCHCTEMKDGKPKSKPMKVALTTGNNIYYSRTLTSIYLHSELFESNGALEIMKLELDLEIAKANNDFATCQEIVGKITVLKTKEPKEEDNEGLDSEKETIYKYKEFQAFHKDEELLKKYPKDLNVKDVTENLDKKTTSIYFKRVLRVDNMKITSAQLDFSRVVPIDADAANTHPKNIFKSKNEDVLVYPVVENFGEGIFFSFNGELISDFITDNKIIKKLQRELKKKQETANPFNKGAVDFANVMNWQMYLVHTFSHLIMRELEFRCGYPTASLSERIYVSNTEEYKMYGCLIYTAEGAEGSMGGLIAQTRPQNLNNLIKSAIKRATICNSDPLCWESEGQGLFDLNFASCFSCSLVSETSCEHRNLYLDRRILVDNENGFFKDVLK